MTIKAKREICPWAKASTSSHRVFPIAPELHCSGSPSSCWVSWDRQEVMGGNSRAAFTAPGEASGFPGLLVDGLIAKQMAVPL